METEAWNMKGELKGGTKRQIFKEEEDKIIKKANVVQISYKYNY